VSNIDITYKEVKELVYNKLISKTDNTPYEDLSERLFGEGNCFNESEVRKRMYGMKRLIEIIEDEKTNGVATTILSLSDLHIPFQLDYQLLEEHRNKIDILQINGDVVDCQALSKFSKQYRISPMEEIIIGRQYLIDLIKYLNPSKVICNYGNHDKRFANYFAKNIDTDILELLPDTSLELIFLDGFNHYDKRSESKIKYEPLCEVFDDIEIEYVDDWKCRIGKTFFVHPLAYRQGMLATADKAKDYLQDTQKEPFDCVVMAHTHKVGDSTKGFIRLLEQGAFADVSKMVYADGRLLAPQKSGFAIICQDEEGNLLRDKSYVKVIEKW
jgi:predicted phosphodiesterase